MNKTITIYELLGLVKDGKAPKKIKYDGDKYTYNDCKDYEIDSSNYNLFETITVTFILNDTVEIIEDNDKLEKIKWNEKESRAGILRTDQEIEVLAKRTETLKKKIAELVDHINKIEEALNVSKDN